MTTYHNPTRAQLIAESLESKVGVDVTIGYLDDSFTFSFERKDDGETFVGSIPSAFIRNVSYLEQLLVAGEKFNLQNKKQ